TKSHLVKAGFEFQTSELQFGAPGQLVQTIVDGVQVLGVLRDTLEAQVLTYHPLQMAAFVQDRVEWNDLRVRAGLRIEYFDANAQVPSDLSNPANAIPEAPQSELRDTAVKLRVAPRVGISFPILDRASLFFSYG